MEYVYRRSYRGPVKLVILDWAGITMDYGCYAPAVVFLAVYRQHQIRAISRMPEVAEAWQKVHGRPVSEPDIEAMAFLSNSRPSTTWWSMSRPRRRLHSRFRHRCCSGRRLSSEHPGFVEMHSPV